MVKIGLKGLPKYVKSPWSLYESEGTYSRNNKKGCNASASHQVKSAPLWQMEVININFISRYLKKRIQFYKMWWFWIIKNGNMLEMKPRCIQTFEKLAKVLVYYVLPFVRNLFQNFQLFFSDKRKHLYTYV